MAKDIRIFISSPGDVTPERLIAKRVIDRLAREFAHHCLIEPVLWERQPLVATGHFQEDITPPSQTDIVVVIIWSRLGTTLPLDKFPGPISGGEVTGTEWEFEDAVKSFRETQLPDLLVYRKRAPVMASLENEEELERQRTQKALVEKFIQTWFVNAQDNTFKAASHSFADPVILEETLELHLRELISNRIGEASVSAVGIRWHEGSPFRGLEAFETKHTQIFFGRTRARNELRELLVRQAARGSAFVLVFGASGSGKSSLVKAGLLPDLMLPGMVENIGLCRVAMMRPSDVSGDLFAGLSAAILRSVGESGLVALPALRELQYDESTLAQQLRVVDQAALPIRQGLQAARKIAGLADHAAARLAIVIDQFEELFTHEYSDAERESFVSTLSALARDGQVWIIATMRSDFFDRLATVPQLAELTAGEGRYLLTPPTIAEIGQIILQPAREAGLRFEANENNIPLDEQLREEASKDPTALPLLEFTLEQLWQQRIVDTGMLTYAAYEDMGGMEGALGKHAEATYNALPDQTRTAFPGVLRALVTVGQGQQASATARTVLLSTFTPGSVQRQLVDEFLKPAARLLLAEGDGEGARVRVAHEALLRCWPRVTEQIEADRQDLQTRARLEQAVSRWQQAATDDKESLLLPPGLPLSEAEDLLARRRDELEPGWADFIDRSVQARDAQELLEREQEHRAREAAEKLAKERTRSAKRFKKWFVAASVISILAMVAFVFAFLQSVEATRQGAIAKAQNAKILLRTKPILGLIESIEAYGVMQRIPKRIPIVNAQTPDEVRNSLFGALQVARVGAMERTRLTGHKTWVSTVAVSANGQLIVSGDDNGWIGRWGGDGQSLGDSFVAHEEDVTSVAVSADGQRFVSGSSDGSMHLWHADGSPLWPASIKHINDEGKSDDVTAVAISANAEVIVSGTASGRVQAWNADGSAIGGGFGDHTDAIMSVVISPDGKLIASASDDNTARLSTLQGEPVAEFLGHKGDVNSVVFSPNGKTIASASEDRTIRLWNRQGVELTDEPFRGHENIVRSVAFSPNGKTIASASEDRTIRLWNLQGKPLAPPLMGHDGPVTAVVFHPNRKTIISSSNDATVRLWDRREPFQGHRTEVHSVAVARKEGTIVSVSAGEEGQGSLRIWDWQGNPGPITEDAEGFYAVAITADGRTIVTGGMDGRITLSDRHGDRMGDPFPDSNAPMISTLAISADGQLIVSAREEEEEEEEEESGAISFWDALGSLQGSIDDSSSAAHTEGVAALAISDDGQTIVSGSWDDTGRVWSRSGEAIATFLPQDPIAHDNVRAVAISSDGQTIASGGNDNKVRLWDRQGKPIGKPMAGHEDVVRSVAFVPGDQFIVSGAEDSTVRLWSVDGKAIGQPFVGHTHWVTGVAVHPDGQNIVSSSLDGTLRVWPIDGLNNTEKDWLNEACRRLNKHSIATTKQALEAQRVCRSHLRD